MVTGTGFSAEQVATILFRDGHKCPMCGHRASTANHRANRGAGGHKGSNRLANGCAVCWTCNGLIESDPVQATIARLRGVKLSRYDDPAAEPYLHPIYQVDVWLDDDGGFTFERTEEVGSPVDKANAPGGNPTRSAPPLNIDTQEGSS